MNRTLLEHPFDPAQIKQRKGRNGVLDYVEGHTVVARLNAALDGAWSFEVVAHEVRDHEVLVLGKLTAAGIVKMQFGASQVTRDRETKALISLGEAGRGRPSTLPHTPAYPGMWGMPAHS